MRKAAAFVPAHISGFFQPCEAKTPERAGSRNCGSCLKLGVLTEVGVKPADRLGVKISINGRRTQEAKTTLAVVDQLLRIAQGSFEVEVNHSCQVPVGAGYGASGAGALGAVLALSRALGLRVPREKLAKMAHVAEVTCRTGLGDVGAQVLGGLVIGLQPGAPPYGRWKRIPVPRDLKVVCATVGPLSTREFLSDTKFRRRAGELGGHAIEKVMKQPTPEEFMLASREFADGLGLLDEELKALIQKAEEVGVIGVSQVMLGRAVFALTRGLKAERIKDAFLSVLSPGQVMVSELNLSGAKFL
jgi:pantoate kinase